jgi:hypothetical protein
MRVRAISTTVVQALKALRQQGLREAIPVFLFLLIIVGLLVAVSALTPLVPFVYSLF